MSAALFAKRPGLKYSTSAGWLQRYRRTKPQRRARQVRLLEAVVEKAQTCGGKSTSPLLVELPGGARLEIRETNQAVLAATLLRSLAKSC